MKNNKNIYILVGIPGAGKSTLIKNILNKIPGRTKVVSRDAIRFVLVDENEPYFSKEKEVFRIFVENIVEGIEKFDNVIIDATHINEASRRKLYNAIKKSYNYKEWEVSALVVNTNVEECLRRNALRTGTRGFVPETAIRNMANSFTMPNLTNEEYFDKIIIYDDKKDIKYKVIMRG